MEGWVAVEATPKNIGELEARIKRKCGDCSACCFTFENIELKKPVNKWCEHACGNGCAIYTAKPVECRAFFCHWLQGYGKEEDRPDKIGIVFDIEPCSGLMIAADLGGGQQDRPMTRVTQMREGVAFEPEQWAMIVKLSNEMMPVVIRGFSDRDVDLVVKGKRTHLRYVEFLPEPDEFVCWAEEPIGSRLIAESAAMSIEERKAMVGAGSHGTDRRGRPTVSVARPVVRPKDPFSLVTPKIRLDAEEDPR